MRDHLSNALMELCADRPLPEITASDVIARADVARQTFYNHFSDIDDLICYTATRALYSSKQPIYSKDNLRVTYEYAREHKPFFTQLKLHTGPNSFRVAGLRWLEERSFTTLFVPGNHENYDRLTGCHDEKLLASWFYAGMPEEEKDRLRKGYPRIAWNGGYVRQLRPSVLMLERGEIFTLGEKTCFAFGGARSHDISDGILDPAAYPDHDAFIRVYRSMTGKMFRVRGVSWWEAEMPTASEMDYGRENLKAFMGTHDRLDFVFTHDAPSSDRILLGYSGSDPLCQYLESLRDIMKYSCWFYGHLHDNRRIMDNHYLLYEQILQIA